MLPHDGNADFDLQQDDRDFIDNQFEDRTNGNVSVNGNGIGTRQFSVKESSIISTGEVISALKLCVSRTPPVEVATLLEILFGNWESKNGHWLYIAQRWSPRAINRTIIQIIKQEMRGEVCIRNPPAYFTKAINFRKKKKNYRVSMVPVKS